MNPEFREFTPADNLGSAEACPHGIPLSEPCATCAQEAQKEQSAWNRVRELQKASIFTRMDPNSPEGRMTNPEGREFVIEAVRNPEQAEVGEVQSLLERTFGEEEVDPQDALRLGLEGKTEFGTPDIAKYKIYAVKDSEGKVVSTVTGGLLDVKTKNGDPTGKTIFMVGYAVTDPSCRQGGLAREAYISALMDCAMEAQRTGKRFAFAAGECTYTSEKFWNKVGWERAYKKVEGEEEKYRELKYVQPPLTFNPDTGEPAEDAGAVPEHVMIDALGGGKPTERDLSETIWAFYRWSSIKPREAFTSDEAYQNHLRYAEGLCDDFGGELSQDLELAFFTGEERKQARERGALFREHVAADHGRAGKEDF